MTNFINLMKLLPVIRLLLMTCCQWRPAPREALLHQPQHHPPQPELDPSAPTGKLTPSCFKFTWQCRAVETWRTWGLWSTRSTCTPCQRRTCPRWPPAEESSEPVTPGVSRPPACRCLPSPPSLSVSPPAGTAANSGPPTTSKDEGSNFHCSAIFQIQTILTFLAV